MPEIDWLFFAICFCIMVIIYLITKMLEYKADMEH